MTSKKGFEGLRVMVVDDERDNLESLGRVLKNLGINVSLYDSSMEALTNLNSEHNDLVITDMKMPEIDGMEFIRRAAEIAPEVPVVVLTAFGSIGNAVEAIKEGATDYLQKPVDIQGLKGVIIKAARSRGMMRELETLRRSVMTGAGEIVFHSSSMERVMKMVRSVAPTTSNVLILGESGTGKELIARAIHEMSKRKENPLIPINCAALTEGLLESELFGHEKGAFTGAVSSSRGKMELAEGGTLFLDEVGDLSLPIQAKLLRALEQKEIMRLGGDRVIYVDVRILAATNADLKGRVERKEFREDLYYRLSVFTISLPPLREREEDIPLLIGHLTKKICEGNDIQEKGVSERVVGIFSRYPWPGNIRELRNTLERMILLSEGDTVTGEHIPQDIRDATSKEAIPVPGRVGPLKKGTLSLPEIQRTAIIETLKATGNNRVRAAKSLGISVRTLYRKLKEYDIK